MTSKIGITLLYDIYFWSCLVRFVGRPAAYLKSAIKAFLEVMGYWGRRYKFRG